MLNKIPANLKPIIAIVGLAAGAILIWLFIAGGQKQVNDPLVIDLSNGRVTTMSHDQFRKTAARSGTSRTIFPVEPNGSGGLRIHNRYRSGFTETLDAYGITVEQASMYLDFSNQSWPVVKDEFVPSWARSLGAAEPPAPREGEDVSDQRPRDR